ncbi:MAG TPA: hypothetical protein ENJ82_09865 [Bacteroidetes bacterium]|nr:hypothetical protein [Bacteroidota bacterium]
MKKCLTTLISILLASTLLFGQSAFSIRLGIQYPEVKNILDSKSSVHVNYEEEGQITARTADHHITYFFHNNVLYKSEMTITYNSTKSAQVTTKAMRNYYYMAQAEVMELENSKTHVRFAALYNREIHEVVQLELDRNTVQVRQMKLDLDRCPGQDLIELKHNKALYSMLYR